MSFVPIARIVGFSFVGDVSVTSALERPKGDVEGVKGREERSMAEFSSVGLRKLKYSTEEGVEKANRPLELAISKWKR